MNSGYVALREGCAWTDLSARGKIVLTGEDRARLLHAMSTQHIQELTPGQGRYVFFLSAQGRILGDAVVLCRPDSLLLDTEPETREKLYAHLDKYIIADDVTLEDATEQYATLDVLGPRAADVLRQCGASLPAEPYAQAEWDTELIVQVTATGGPGYRILTPVSEKAELVLALEEKGAVVADADSVRTVRLEQQHPRYGEDFTESNLPHETQQMQALHFQKGCYLGQEIVERVRSQGRVNRLLIGLLVEGTLPPPAKTKISAEGQDVGEITSAAYSPALGAVAALGYVRARAREEGVALQAGELVVKIR